MRIIASRPKAGARASYCAREELANFVKQSFHYPSEEIPFSYIPGGTFFNVVKYRLFRRSQKEWEVVNVVSILFY